MEIALIVTIGVIGLTGMAFVLFNKMVKKQFESRNIKIQKEILELEIKKQENQIKLLEEENKKYDKLINNYDKINYD